MKKINIEIPDDLHQELKVEAAKGLKTMKEYIVFALQNRKK